MGVGYTSGGLGVIQIGMLEYRASLPLSSKIGTFSRFSSIYRTLGATSKFLGGASTYIGAPLSLYCDYQSLKSNEIEISRFAYRQIGLGASIATGFAIGGPWGAAGGAIVAAGFITVEYIYDGAVNIWNLTINQISNFENAIKSGWYPGR